LPSTDSGEVLPCNKPSRVEVRKPSKRIYMLPRHSCDLQEKRQNLGHPMCPAPESNSVGEAAWQHRNFLETILPVWISFSLQENMQLATTEPDSLEA
jgi:hypothetical protein